jgi:hypothetical protein
MESLKVTKRAYVKYITTMAVNGYDISDLLHPVYKNIDAQSCIDICNKIMEEVSGSDVWEYEEKITLENL